MMEYDDPNLIAGTQSQGAQPLGIQSSIKGKLHFRMANVGHYADSKANLMSEFTIVCFTFFWLIIDL